MDGHHLRDIKIESLRKQIGIVLQETTLFSGTVRVNIAFGRSDASEEEVIAVAKAAQAHDFIMSFPDAYNTHVGERGACCCSSNPAASASPTPKPAWR